MTLKPFVLALCLAVLVLSPGPAPTVVAQEGRLDVAQEQRPRRSLFEVLFGTENNAAPPAATQQQRSSPPRTTPQPRSAPPASPPPAATPVRQPEPADDMAKAENATRVAVFGDSQAIDLARALERLYAQDPGTVVIAEAVGSSGFVRDDFFDWNRALEEALAADSFEIAVVMIGINDRQALGGHAPLSEGWRRLYTERLERFLGALRQSGKPVVWIELPPMEQSRFSADMTQISALHRAASFAAGAEWVETYERYLSEDGRYTALGPDLNGQVVPMRKSDGIHLSAAGADRLAFYVDRAMRPHHAGGGGVSIEVADPLAGTDAADMMRPPFQGLGQTRHFEVAGAIQQISGGAARASELLLAGGGPPAGSGFALEELVRAPMGRADAFGVGQAPAGDGERQGFAGGR